MTTLVPVVLVDALGQACGTPASVALVDPGQAAATAALCRALGDPVRLQLLNYIASAPGGTACSCELPEALGVSQPTMSHHLSKLVEAGVLERERRGRWAHYRLLPDGLSGLGMLTGIAGRTIVSGRHP